MALWFKYQGQQSTQFSSLIISSLPPIVKPRMRIKETQVDGIDGSVIEALGYEAYDKVIKIGLKNTDEIDDIISWLSAFSGDLTLSNEPDRLYKANLCEQIDFEKLLRFRTAELKFRVQPFKYALDDEQIQFTGSGTIVKNNGNYQSLPRFRVHGSGTVEISIDYVPCFSYTFPSGEQRVDIDSAVQDAYYTAQTSLRNRNMTGEFPKLKPGGNIITWTGNVGRIYVYNRSRWI